MPKTILAALALLVVVAGAMLLSRQGGDKSQPQTVSNGTGDEEAAALEASNGLAWREGPALNLRMKTGEILTLTDRLSCGDIPCPKELATRYRYLGWSRTAGGYRLSVLPGTEAGEPSEMILPFAEDPILVDAHHPESPGNGPLDQPPAPAASGNDESLNEWLTEISEGRSQGEAPRIAQSGGGAKRDGMRLTLTLEGGRRFSLTDDLACGQLSCPPQVFRSFTYSGSSPDGRYRVVEVASDELTTAIFVSDADGAVTELLGQPKFSPDGSRAIDVIANLEWSAPRRLELWSLKSRTPKVEFSVPADDEDDTVYEIEGWSDNDHVRLRRGPWDGPWRGEAMLVHDMAGWHLEGAN